jgi:FAD:protein FMN transferase
VKLGRLAPAAALLLGLAALGRGADAPPAGVTRDFRYMMGTSIQVAAFGGDEAARRAAIDEAFGAFAEVDRLMSNYRDDSELSRVNRLAARQAVPVSDPLLAVLQAAEQVSERSGGAFDVTVAPLVRLWGFKDKKPHLPSAAELAAVRPLVGYHNLLIDSQSKTLRFARPGVEIDLGGIAKGFAVELAAGVLRRHGLGGFVDAGGNQYLLGLPPGERSWRVGIKNPVAKEALLGVLELPEGSLSVSTSAQDSNFLVADGRRYGHILDPRTLQPSQAALSVTIVSPDGTLADALSKVGFVLGPKRGLQVIESFPDTGALIAYRKADGSIAIDQSASLAGRFHPEPLRPAGR